MYKQTGGVIFYIYDANCNLTAKGNEWVEYANGTAEIIKDTRATTGITFIATVLGSICIVVLLKWMAAQ